MDAEKQIAAAPGNVETVVVPPIAPAPTSAVPLTQEQIKAVAVRTYHDAVTREAKASVVKQYPLLAKIYCSANHS